MAKARPQTPAIERAIAAFKRAHPSCPHGVVAHKVRSRQLIRVRGYELPESSARTYKEMTRGVTAEWSYSNNGLLRRVS